MNCKALSIIIPAYNASPHIEKCLCSLSDQANDLVEIILVDDVSKDDTVDVCESFRLAHPRLSLNIITKENGGAFSARVCGIEHAQAEFVVFVDSDDVLLPGAIELILGAIDDYEPDVVLFGHTRRVGQSGLVSSDGVHQLEKSDCLLRLCSSTEMNPVWGKGIRKSCLSSYEAGSFPSMNMAEDLFQIIDVFDCADVFVEIDAKLYCYSKNANGLTSNFRSDYLESISIAYGKLRDHAKKWEVAYGQSLYAPSGGVYLQQLLSIARCAASSLSREEAFRLFELLSQDERYRELCLDGAINYCAFAYRLAYRMIESRHYRVARVYFRILTRIMNAIL